MHIPEPKQNKDGTWRIQLRHSFASLSAHLRIPKEISMEIGGWSNDKIMTEIYTHIARSDIERYKNEMWEFYNNRAQQ